MDYSVTQWFEINYPLYDKYEMVVYTDFYN